MHLGLLLVENKRLCSLNRRGEGTAACPERILSLRLPSKEPILVYFLFQNAKLDVIAPACIVLASTHISIT